jgi:hypothetical protein
MVMALMRLLNPERETIQTWTNTKSRRASESMKWMVRADCVPPSRLTAAGTAETNAGDRARPDQTSSGKRMKITPM